MLYSRQRRIVLLKAASLFSTLTDTFEEILAAQLNVIRNRSCAGTDRRSGWFRAQLSSITMTRVTVLICFMLTMCLLIQEGHVTAFSGTLTVNQKGMEKSNARKLVQFRPGP